MVKIVPTPDWFLGKDIIIEFFSLLVLVIFTVLAYRHYRLSRNRNVLYLGSGFGLIALAQLATILTKLVLYYDIGPSQAIGQAIVSSQIVNSIDLFYYAGFFFHRLLTLVGLYIIYRLPRTQKSIGDYALVVYFIVISSILSREFYYLFHLTAFFLLIMIVENYYRVYQENKFYNTKILMLAFGLLAVSQFLFILSGYEALFVSANLIEAISYTIFLAIIIRILKHGKKKKSNGYNIRHFGNRPRKKR
jgi:hypothetical protein